MRGELLWHSLSVTIVVFSKVRRVKLWMRVWIRIGFSLGFSGPEWQSVYISWHLLCCSGSSESGSPQDDSSSESQKSRTGKRGLTDSRGPNGHLQETSSPEVLGDGTMPQSATSKALWPCTRLARHLGLPWLLQAPASQINRVNVIRGGICTGGLLPVRKRRLLRDVIGDDERPFKVSVPLSSVFYLLPPQPFSSFISLFTLFVVNFRLYSVFFWEITLINHLIIKKYYYAIQSIIYEQR